MLIAEAVTILIVEDDEDVRNAIVEALREDGIDVESVTNGVEGLYQAQNWEFDAIVLDVMLPGLNGWEILKRIRREKKTPVLMLTARGDVEERIHGLNSGADDYLVKPYDPGELVARLRALVRRTTGHADNIIDLGRVIIDTVGQSITLDGESVKLSPAQYKIVEYLARSAGAIVSRDALCEALLIEDEEAFSNVLDVQIYNIRKKLGKSFLESRLVAGYIIPKA